MSNKQGRKRPLDTLKRMIEREKERERKKGKRRNIFNILSVKILVFCIAVVQRALGKCSKSLNF